MANERHLEILNQGVEAWNAWREENSEMQPDLKEADLSGANLSEVNLNWAILSKANLSDAIITKADFSWTNLSEADLRGAILGGINLRGAILSKAKLGGAKFSRADLSLANLSEADISGADLRRVDLSEANLSKAILNGVNLRGANLYKADFSDTELEGARLERGNLIEATFTNAKLTRADLTKAVLVETNLENANLTDCRIYGISAWNLKLHGTIQSDLVITRPEEAIITVDNLEVAQFIYLLLKNEKIRDVIDTITSKVVLILGRFTPERKEILDALREELRKRNYSPVLFDFEKSTSRDLMETVTLLARMARFIIADITDAKSIPAELERIVPDLPSVPVQPLMLRSDYEYALFGHIKRFPWVLEEYLYDTCDGLLAVLGEAVITPAEKKSKEIREKANRN